MLIEEAEPPVLTVAEPLSGSDTVKAPLGFVIVNPQPEVQPLEIVEPSAKETVGALRVRVAPVEFVVAIVTPLPMLAEAVVVNVMMPDVAVSPVPLTIFRSPDVAFSNIVPAVKLPLPVVEIVPLAVTLSVLFTEILPALSEIA